MLHSFSEKRRDTGSGFTGEVFHMAAEGISHSEIARQLNAAGIPTRYLYHKLKGDNFPDKQPHVKIKKWDNSAVRDIITDETYLGTLFWDRAKCGMDSGKKRVEQPREKWIVVENQHEALVSQKIFKQANDNIVGLDMSGQKTGRRNLFFVCGYCGKGLRFSSRKKEKYSCRSRTQETENDCQRVVVSKKEIEGAVLAQVRVMADMWMEELEQARREAQAELDRMQEVSGLEEISDEELKGFSELESFDKDKLKVLIEKVIVYGADAMEIVWKVRNPFGDGESV